VLYAMGAVMYVIIHKVDIKLSEQKIKTRQQH